MANINKRWLPRKFTIEVDVDENGAVVSVPEITGCHTQGKSLESALRRLVQVIWLCRVPTSGYPRIPISLCRAPISMEPDLERELADLRWGIAGGEAQLTEMKKRLGELVLLLKQTLMDQLQSLQKSAHEQVKHDLERELADLRRGIAGGEAQLTEMKKRLGELVLLLNPTKLYDLNENLCHCHAIRLPIGQPSHEDPGNGKIHTRSECFFPNSKTLQEILNPPTKFKEEKKLSCQCNRIPCQCIPCSCGLEKISPQTSQIHSTFDGKFHGKEKCYPCPACYHAVNSKE